MRGMAIVMTELQTILLESMVQFDALCEKEHLTYYMLGGTMLGAYRHQGFIPWDDDMDIGMPREDYERLLRLSQEKIPNGYELRHFSKEKNVPYAFAHFENANTTYIEERRSGGGYLGGVYLEIFPLDNTSETKLQAILMEKKIWFLKKILYATLIQGQTGKGKLKQFIISGIGKCTTTDRMVRKLDKALKQQKGTLYYSNYLGHWGRRETVSVECLQGKTNMSCRYLFEGKQFCGAAYPEQYLTALYGETFMTPPAEAEREAGKHPPKYIDFKTPYKTRKEGLQ